MQFGSFRRHIWALPLEITMVVGGVVTIVQHDWFHLLTCIFTTTVSFLPLWFERTFKVYILSWLQFTYVAFVFASMFCGEVLHFYRNVIGWDELMHSLSGLLVGFAIAVWLRYLMRHNRRMQLSAWLQVLLIICLNCVIALSWEIVEFASDQWFGTTSQDTSLFDTMTDLIYGSFSGVILALLYGRMLSGRKVTVLSRALTTFEKINH